MAIILATLFSSPLAQAGARQHYDAGQDYYTQGRYNKAIEEFEEAYRLDPRPKLLYNIAQSYEKAGDLPKAAEYLERYLKEDKETEERTSLENKIKNLKERIANTGIEVKANKTGAAIYVDGKKKGRTPAKKVIRLEPGAHKVRITKKGYDDFEMNVAVSSGHSIPIEATLELSKSATQTVLPPSNEKSTSKDMEEEKEPVDALDVVPWVIAGVGGAAAIVGLGVFGGMAVANDDHDMALLADYIGWPGVGVAAGGLIWGIIRITSKQSEKLETQAINVVPLFDRDRAFVLATFTL